jgi:hypothetical protein
MPIDILGHSAEQQDRRSVPLFRHAASTHDVGLLPRERPA